MNNYKNSNNKTKRKIKTIKMIQKKMMQFVFNVTKIRDKLYSKVAMICIVVNNV